MNEKIGLLFAKYCDIKDLQPPHYNALSREGLEKLLSDESFPLEALVKFYYGQTLCDHNTQMEVLLNGKK